MIQDQGAQPKRSDRAYQAHMQAARGEIQAAVTSIQDVAGAVATFEEKKRKAEEVYIHNQTSLALQKFHDQFTHAATSMPDQAIMPAFEEQAKAFQTNVVSSEDFAKMSPKAQEHLTFMVEHSLGEMRGENQVHSDLKASHRRAGAAKANYNEFLDKGDPAWAYKAAAAIKMAVKAGDIDSAEGDMWLRDIPHQLQIHQAINAIKNDPQNAATNIEELNRLTDKEKIQFKGEARTQWTRVEADNAENLRTGFDRVIADGEKNNKPIDYSVMTQQVTDAELSHKISARMATQLRTSLVRADVQLDRTKSEELYLDAYNADVSDVEEFNRIRGEAQTISSPDRRGHVLGLIKRRMNAAVNPFHEQVHRDNETLRGNGFFFPPVLKPGEHHWISANEPDTFVAPEKKKTTIEAMPAESAYWENNYGPGMTKQKVLEIEQRDYAQYVAKVETLKEQHPPEKQTDYYPEGFIKDVQAIRANTTEKMINAAMIGLHPNIKPADFKKLKKGDKYWWNGELVPKE